MRTRRATERRHHPPPWFGGRKVFGFESDEPSASERREQGQSLCGGELPGRQRTAIIAERAEANRSNSQSHSVWLTVHFEQYGTLCTGDCPLPGFADSPVISVVFQRDCLPLPFMYSHPRMSDKYTMTISRLTVDKLGVKLYDRVSAVIAEIVANSYDADAQTAVIRAPMGAWLATKSKGKVKDQGFVIEVDDDGAGMTVDEVNEFYLKVGKERRSDPKRGEVSKKFHRKVMGRKGVGKLAPFGVCERIEVITAGGSRENYTDQHGKQRSGYAVCHLVLKRGDILNETDAPYYPQPGPLDGTHHEKHGTAIRMTIFDYRRVPTIDEFERQMAQRFGLRSANWKIVLQDTSKKPGDDGYECGVGEFQLEANNATKITFSRKPHAADDSREGADYIVQGPVNVALNGLQPGFIHEERFYPIAGWVGYAIKPYKDELMAGIRIYCRGKIAAQTSLFELTAGFTGEHDVRSYLIGELHANWLDEGEDLIRTDRQDILWSHELGQAFQVWGQALVKLIGKITREPMRKSSWAKFLEASNIEARVEKAFPGKDKKEIREQTMEMAETIAKAARRDELDDMQTVESFVQLSLLLGPHVTLDRKLKEAAASQDRPMAVVSEVLRTARIAELASFGRIVDDRVRVIETLEKLKDDKATDEAEFQKLLTEAPWTINPTWSPITSNQSFETLRREFIKFYKKHTGEDLVLHDFADRNKRADFVLSSQDDTVQIIEIKRPHHKLTNAEMDRIVRYYDLLRQFLDEDGNQGFAEKFPKYHITLVCDGLALTGSQRAAFNGYKKSDDLTHITWKTFLLRTRQAHEEFLKEAARQKKLAEGEA